ncbi:ABC-type multidrug transport system ATPase subunit [Alkalihalobacillus xiaoxiensis]|uniref:ABC-type multidrug transport system ATPase subunit n=1 Tax=Shouchella xiaoxiensis TaxID=766895 RepID=A0ABS2SX49_9BACI|nr:ATP-binding cassette domain-containing protein [Shouchella xiaoxiensis]MBM7839810.1 ABC-type multidrug transport system ATPase subunit [Shouchella xiaoxiensis]
MLIVKEVSKQYQTFTALENITLEFSNGLYALLAPNGAGKTTLIKMLTTLIQPSKGDILYDGQNILDMNEAYRDLLGYLPQQFGYYKHYSALEYLLYLAALKGLPRKEAITLSHSLLDKVGLAEVKKKKLRKFSGGMIQRVGIAQALLNDPKVVILDEPTAGLDPKERARFRKLLTDLARDRIVIVSTHIVSDIEAIANEIIMIKHKQISYQGSIEQVCKTLDGLVYETTIPYEELAAFQARHFILAEKQEQGQMNVRFIHKGEVEEGWNSVTPNLDDVFLNEYKDEETGV